MVSFNIGGVPELVRPEITEYLAQPEDAKYFGNGIIQLLEDDKLPHQMIQNCRAVACAEYSLEIQVKRYTRLYYQVLHGTKKD